jgi:hypothetical protein
MRSLLPTALTLGLLSIGLASTLTACGDNKVREIPESFRGTWYSKNACTDCAVKDCDITVAAHTFEYVSGMTVGDAFVLSARGMETATAAIDDARPAEPVPGGFKLTGVWIDGDVSLVGDMLKQGEYEFVRTRPTCDQAAYDAALAKSKAEEAEEAADELKRAKAPACSQYLDCICGFSDNTAMEKACEDAEKLLARAAEGSCRSALAVWKKSIHQSKAMYEAAGIDIPSACE